MTEIILTTAVFDSAVDAARTVDRLLESGVGREQITVLMAEDMHRKTDEPIDLAADPAAHESGRSLTTGAIGGGALGALVGTAIAIPGLGLIAAGTLAAALGGGVLGAAGGGLLGTLVGLGVRADAAKVYERELQQGAVLLGVSAQPEVAQGAKDILAEGGGHDFATVDRIG